jgi:RNA polymerase sigma-70 factor (ECF subfamily)
VEDQVLAAAAARGDQAAFTQIIERYRRYIHAIAWRIVLGQEDALDVTQNVFVQVACKIGDYRGEGSLKSWLSAIAARQALDWRRSRGPEEPTEPEALEALAQARGESDWSAVRAGLDREWMRARVGEAMASLSAQQRAIFALRFYEEMKPGEIGERLGIPAPQVRAQLARAVAKLREAVGREEENRGSPGAAVAGERGRNANGKGRSPRSMRESER